MDITQTPIFYTYCLLGALWIGYAIAYSGDPLICGGTIDPRNEVILTVSSEIVDLHSVRESCLNNIAASDSTGSWSTSVNNVDQWIMVDLDSIYTVTDIATQGRPSMSQWVTAYELGYSINNVDWPYIVDNNGNTVQFQGNSDQHTVVEHALEQSIIAEYVKLYIVNWHSHISMRWEIYGSLPAAHSGDPLICGGTIDPRNEVTLTVSSEIVDLHGVQESCLNNIQASDSTGSWSTTINNVDQWIMVELDSIYSITHIATQGRPSMAQWVTAYELGYSLNNEDWFYVVDNNGNTVQFQGNSNQHTIVEHALEQSIIAKFVKLYVVTWYSHISMRWEIYGSIQDNLSCSALICSGQAQPRSEVSLSASSAWWSDNVQLLLDENGSCYDNQFNSSNNLPGSWIAGVSNVDQWIEVELETIYRIFAIATKGRPSGNSEQYVTSYTVLFSHNAETWEYVSESHSGEAMEFQANNDIHTPVQHVFERQFTAKFIRLHPLSWNNHISMRWEIYGCKDEIAVNNTIFTLVTSSRRTDGIMTSYNDMSEINCAFKCMRTVGCDAFNANSQTLECQLIQVNGTDETETIVHSSDGWVYYYKGAPCSCEIA